MRKILAMAEPVIIITPQNKSRSDTNYMLHEDQCSLVRCNNELPKPFSIGNGTNQYRQYLHYFIQKTLMIRTIPKPDTASMAAPHSIVMITVSHPGIGKVSTGGILCQLCSTCCTITLSSSAYNEL